MIYSYRITPNKALSGYFFVKVYFSSLVCRLSSDCHQNNPTPKRISHYQIKYTDYFPNIKLPEGKINTKC